MYNFENIQAKYTTELISFEIQCFNRSTKFSGKINDQEATFVFVFATDSILVHGVLKKIIMFFLLLLIYNYSQFSGYILYASRCQTTVF
jgi:hypothetical protein